jgi:hypothetical protein
MACHRPLHLYGAGYDEPPYAWKMPFVFILVLLAIFVVVVWLISVIHYKQVRFAQQQSDLKFESDLQLAKSRSNESQLAPTWKPPKLPSSVIAAIWSNRFINSPTQYAAELQRHESTLKMLSWDYHREAPYMVAAAFLSLRDAGLIRLFVAPHGGLLDSDSRVRVERTDLALASADMPAVEGGLLLACMDLAHKRFGKTTQPAAYSVVREWIHKAMGHPYRWVRGVALQQGRELGLFEPTVKRRGFGKLFGSSPPVYSIEHLAACDDQVVASLARWEEIALNEPELQTRLIIEVAGGINARQESGG